MDSSRKSSNKIRDIVRLQQILKKWKKLANNNRSTTSSGGSTTTTTAATTTGRSIKFLKKTLSFSESSSSSSPALGNAVPKGYIAVCVGEELKRFVIPTEYLSHQLFGVLLREAEEEFGFQQEGLLKFPCEVELFEKILKMMEDKRSSSPPQSPSPSSSLLLQHDHDDGYHEFGLIVGDHRHHDFINTTCVDNYSPDAADQLTPSHHHPQMMCR